MKKSYIYVLLNYTETLKKKCLPYFNLILISGQDVNPKYFFFQFKKIVSESLIRISAKKDQCKNTN